MIFVKLWDMPIKVRSFALPDFENPLDTIVVVNANLSLEERHEAMEHELLHICRDDLFSGNECDLIEAGTHMESYYHGEGN